MKAVCIKSEHPKIEGLPKPKFTIGEVYDVFPVDGYDGLYATVDDTPSYQFGIMDNFELISDMRDRKIDELIQ